MRNLELETRLSSCSLARFSDLSELVVLVRNVAGKRTGRVLVGIVEVLLHEIDVLIFLSHSTIRSTFVRFPAQIAEESRLKHGVYVEQIEVVVELLGERVQFKLLERYLWVGHNVLGIVAVLDHQCSLFVAQLGAGGTLNELVRIRIQIDAVQSVAVYVQLFVPVFNIRSPADERHYRPQTQCGALGHSKAHRTGDVLDDWQIFLFENQLAHRVDQIEVEIVEQVESIFDADSIAHHSPNVGDLQEKLFAGAMQTARIWFENEYANERPLG